MCRLGCGLAWAEGCTSSIIFARWRQYALMGGHVTVTCRIALNHLSTAAMRLMSNYFDHLSSLDTPTYIVAQIAERFEPNTLLWAFHTIQPSSCIIVAGLSVYPANCWGGVLTFVWSAQKNAVTARYLSVANVFVPDMATAMYWAVETTPKHSIGNGRVQNWNFVDQQGHIGWVATTDPPSVVADNVDRLTVCWDVGVDWLRRCHEQQLDSLIVIRRASVMAWTTPLLSLKLILCRRQSAPSSSSSPEVRYMRDNAIPHRRQSFYVHSRF